MHLRNYSINNNAISHETVPVKFCLNLNLCSNICDHNVKSISCWLVWSGRQCRMAAAASTSPRHVQTACSWRLPTRMASQLAWPWSLASSTGASICNLRILIYQIMREVNFFVKMGLVSTWTTQCWPGRPAPTLLRCWCGYTCVQAMMLRTSSQRAWASTTVQVVRHLRLEDVFLETLFSPNIEVKKNLWMGFKNPNGS